MTGFISQLTGSGSAKAAAQAAQQQEGLAQSDQGRQLSLLSKQDAQTDDASAAMNGPGIGRAMLGFTRRQAAGTLGG